MPLKFRQIVDPANRCIFMERSGDYSGGHLNHSVSEMLADPNYEPGFNFLVDARNMDYTGASYSVLTKFTNAWEALDMQMGPSRMAFVHANTMNFGVSRQSQIVFETPQVIRHPFYEMPEALEWLGLPPDLDVPKILEAAAFRYFEPDTDDSNSSSAD